VPLPNPDEVEAVLVVQIRALLEEEAAWTERWGSGQEEREVRFFAHEIALGQDLVWGLTATILWELLDDFVLVSDEEINEAIRLLAQHGKQVAEGAGAASLAAAIKLRDQLRGMKVVGVLTGGNIPADRLAATLSAGSAGVSSSGVERPWL